MLRGLSTVTFWADDLEAATRWYTEMLGVEPYFNSADRGMGPGYVEFRFGDYQHELGLIDRSFAPEGSGASTAGARVYWHVDDIDAELARLEALGAKVYEPRQDRSESWATASVTDPFGNVIGLIRSPHYLEILAARGGS
jgi:predicted enzyme related to lactoylglutathione lyase